MDKFNPQPLLMQRKTIAGSLIGSIAETAEVLEFCAKNNIYPRVELIEAEELNDAYKKVEEKKARYRYVVNLASLKKEEIEKLEDIGEVSHLLPEQKEAEFPFERQELSPGWSQELQ